MTDQNPGMADPAARTLRLLSLLQRRRYWPGPDLAARLEVSERTLRRDIDRLRELGYTVDSDRGVDGGYRLGGATGGAVLLLDDDEATALAVALHVAARGSSELAEASLGALTKVVSMLGPAQRERAENVRSAIAFGAPTDATAPPLAVVEVVAAACRDQVRLSFDYVAADGAATHRYVEPCQLVALDSRWYLVAYDDDREDWRTFRVDRMREPVPARNSFVPRPPPATNLAEFVRFDMSARNPSHRVVIDVDLPGAEVRAHYGTWVTVEEMAVDRCRVVMYADSFRWPTHIVANLDAGFTIVEPLAFREHLAAMAVRWSTATAT